MCECDRWLALKFLPHQTQFGTESGTHRRFSVTGFAPKMCAECRGQKEEAHPRAAIYGQKGKVERYYWREIFKTICELADDWMEKDANRVRDINEFRSRFPKKYKELDKQVRKTWQERHQKAPKYDMKEITEAEFLSKVKVPEREIRASYLKVINGDNEIGRFLDKSGKALSAENIADEFYTASGYETKRCERRLISIWVGTFLAPVIQDFGDPRLRWSFRHSTRGWTTKDRNTPIVYIWKPEDFGSKEYYRRRCKVIDEWIEKLRRLGNLLPLFEELLDEGTPLRDYLWVNEDEDVKLASAALHVIPSEMVVRCVEWAIKDFWDRRPGWPDLFVYKDSEYLFAEVKSPKDELSIEQMNWFRWAIEDSHLPCEICRIRKV
jgi:hypothetical protein